MKKESLVKRGWCLFLTVALIVGMTPIRRAEAAAAVGKVEEVAGIAWITPAGSKQPKKAKTGLPIGQGDKIKTLPGGKVRISFVDGSTVSVASDTQLVVDEYVFDPGAQTRSSVLSVIWGKVRCKVNELTGYKQKQFKVNTTTATVGVRGTDFMVWVKTKGKTQIAAFKNAVDVASTLGKARAIILNPGAFTEVLTGMAPSAPARISPAMLKTMLEGLLPADAIPPKLPETPDLSTGSNAADAAGTAADAAGTAANAAGAAANTAASAAGTAAAAAAVAGAAVGAALSAAKAAYDAAKTSYEKNKTEEERKKLEEAQAALEEEQRKLAEDQKKLLDAQQGGDVGATPPDAAAAGPAPDMDGAPAPAPTTTAALTPKPMAKPVVSLRKEWKSFRDAQHLSGSERTAQKKFKKFWDNVGVGALRFLDNGDGTVTDSATGLMWQKDFAQENSTGFAPGYVDEVNKKQMGGHTDWRLPTAEELLFLYLSVEADPSIPIDMPPKNRGLWSSDKAPVVGTTSQGYVFAWHYKDFFGEGYTIKIPEAGGSFTFHNTKAVRDVN